MIKSGYSHISEPALELYSRAMPNVGGNITAQSVLTHREKSLGKADQKKSKRIVFNLNGLLQVKKTFTSSKDFYKLKRLLQDENNFTRKNECIEYFPALFLSNDQCAD